MRLGTIFFTRIDCWMVLLLSESRSWGTSSVIVVGIRMGPSADMWGGVSWRMLKNNKEQSHPMMYPRSCFTIGNRVD